MTSTTSPQSPTASTTPEQVRAQHDADRDRYDELTASNPIGAAVFALSRPHVYATPPRSARGAR